MCGIAALYSEAGFVSDHTLKLAAKTLHHRGPDSHGTWLSSDHRVGLAHARLSIIDLTTGDQPIPNEDGQVRIIVNGEFYDFERQRRELEQRGHRFRTRSDSEIALHLYEDFGAHCVQHLRGEFAFLLWDDRNQILLAVRDRFGIKPLHYAVHDNTLYLASEAKALFAAGVPARWDYEYFYQHATGPAMADRMEMAHSIEGRVPFLDHHVVECVYRAPVSMKIRGITEKYLLREAAKPVITDTVYRRQKHPFLAPPVTLTPTERFHQMMQDTLRGPVLGSLPFYNQKKIIALLDKIPAMSEADRISWDLILMSILSACVVHQRFHLAS